MKPEPAFIPTEVMVAKLRRYMAETGEGTHAITARVCERFPRHRPESMRRELRHLLAGGPRCISLWRADELCIALDIALPHERCRKVRGPRVRR